MKDQEPDDFASPEQLPASEQQRGAWQQSNNRFWEAHPMRYDWNDELALEPFSIPYYQEIDRRFFDNVRDFMPWTAVPFDLLVDFKSLTGKRILEVGIGSGSHAALLSAHAASYVGIDITSHATQSTAKRLRLFGLHGSVVRMDAEAMAFADDSFDIVWSWGVIHHSADTKQVLREMARVLRPGGRAIVMVYHRGWWNYYVSGFLFHGLLRRRWFATRSLHRMMQSLTDGALARYYSARTWSRLVQDLFVVENLMVKGSKAEVIPLPPGRVKTSLARLFPSRLARCLTNQLRMGSFLISTLAKR